MLGICGAAGFGENNQMTPRWYPFPVVGWGRGGDTPSIAGAKKLISQVKFQRGGNQWKNQRERSRSNTVLQREKKLSREKQ
ncbi:hypothetical protein TNCT_711301 [Trichonephila clavata]|uniref:Uncharacterized protein n=1 Tax=Trichonephila clavata TaxID=2740835 RepID=A0A8X6FBG7_TRICU|nr:hypothetical protein TNCT_711301 [Trichonephila clavata]